MKKCGECGVEFKPKRDIQCLCSRKCVSVKRSRFSLDSNKAYASLRWLERKAARVDPGHYLSNF